MLVSLSLSDLASAGATVADLKAAGISAIGLKSEGISLAELKEAVRILLRGSWEIPSIPSVL